MGQGPLGPTAPAAPNVPWGQAPRAQVPGRLASGPIGQGLMGPGYPDGLERLPTQDLAQVLKHLPLETTGAEKKLQELATNCRGSVQLHVLEKKLLRLQI